MTDLEKRKCRKAGLLDVGSRSRSAVNSQVLGLTASLTRPSLGTRPPSVCAPCR